MGSQRPRRPIRVTGELLALHRRRAGELRAAARRRVLRHLWRWLRRLAGR